MARIIAAPSILAASVFGVIWLAATLGLNYESRSLLAQCQATSADPASCHLRIYGR
jgi:hypothetical protein